MCWDMGISASLSLYISTHQPLTAATLCLHIKPSLSKTPNATSKTILSGHFIAKTPVWIYPKPVSLKLKLPPPWEPRSLSTVLSPTSSLPPWDGSRPPAFQPPGALALPDFPSPPLPLFRPFQTCKISRNLATCTFTEGK